MCGCSGYTNNKKDNSMLTKLKNPMVTALAGGLVGYFYSVKKGGDTNNHIKFVLFGLVGGYILGMLLFPNLVSQNLSNDSSNNGNKNNKEEEDSDDDSSNGDDDED